MRFLQQTHKCAEKFTLVSSIYVPLRPQNGILACVKHAECLVLYLTIIYTFTRVCESLPGRKLQQLSGSQTDLEMTDIILRVSDDAVKKVVDFVSLCPKVEVVSCNCKRERRLTDDILSLAIDVCQADFWAASAWAVVYRVLQAYHDEKRSVNRYEKDMAKLKPDMKMKCSDNTVQEALKNNPILKHRPEDWDCLGASRRILRLRDRLKDALNALLH